MDRRAHLLESGCLAARNVVDVEATLVDEFALRTTISSLWDADVRSVLVVEEHHSGPVVGLVLDKVARCAGRQLSRIVVGIHAHVETVAADDLV